MGQNESQMPENITETFVYYKTILPDDFSVNNVNNDDFNVFDCRLKGIFVSPNVLNLSKRRFFLYS